jgi:hypothetical protein
VTQNNVQDLSFFSSTFNNSGISAITKIENLRTIPRFGFKVVNG